MSKIYVHIEDGMLMGAHSDDPNLELVVFDFDWNGNPEPLYEMQDNYDTSVVGLYQVDPEIISPFEFE